MFISITSWELAVVSAYTPPEMGSSPSSEETHSLVGQLDTEEAPINVGQNCPMTSHWSWISVLGHMTVLLFACQSLSYLKVICIHPRSSW